MLIAALFMVAKTWRQPKCPVIEDWIKKMGYIYATECYSVTRKDAILSFVTTWVILENIMLNETQSEKAKNCMNLLIYGI